MKKWIFIFLSMALAACEQDEMPVIYYQFTSDDLSHLYFNKNTLVYTGIDIDYKDTLTYLLNDSDSVRVMIDTKINSYYSSPFPFYNIKDIGGKTVIHFNNKTGFNHANITISRGSDIGYVERFFEVGANGINGFQKQYFSKDTASLDTAMVLGKIYQNVYKFYPPVEDKTDIRLIYFAKMYGYIKIEKLDGTKIELTNSENKEQFVRLHNQ
jgi:hypothetical protein